MYDARRGDRNAFHFKAYRKNACAQVMRERRRMPRERRVPGSRKREECPEPDSNRHGREAEGF